jgi:hypothetical protein
VFGELVDLVPKRFARVTPASTYQFRVLEPRDWQFEREVVHCKLRRGGQKIPLVLSWASEPLLASAIAGLARLPKNGPWAPKYLDLYKILEEMAISPSEDQKALRHALAHAPTSLNRPSTVACLRRLFGSVHLNLSLAANQRTFWRLFGEMLVLADKTIAERLDERLDEIVRNTSKAERL